MLTRILAVLALAASVASAYGQIDSNLAQVNLKQPSNLVATATATTVYVNPPLPPARARSS
jgi:hypothetical protein